MNKNKRHKETLGKYKNLFIDPHYNQQGGLLKGLPIKGIYLFEKHKRWLSLALDLKGLKTKKFKRPALEEDMEDN